MSTAAFHESQRKLDLVKRNAHDILGVKREQVHRVVESLSRPGQYEITVHRDGRVEYHTWTVPAIEDVMEAFDTIETYENDPETPSAATEPEAPVEEVDNEVPVISDENNANENLINVDEPLAEGQVAVPSAPESPAAANPAPRRRGRPSKS